MKLVRRATDADAAVAVEAPVRDVHASHTKLVDPVDPGYWPRSIGLRVVIAACYFILIPAGLLPMSTAWWLVSGGGLLAYSIATFAMYFRYPEFTKRVQSDWAPYIDALFITLAVIAVAEPDYPIWIGYILVIQTLSTFHSTRYMLAYSVFAIALFWLGIWITSATGREEIGWQISVIASIMTVFSAMNGDVISQSTKRLREMVLEASLTDPLTGLDNRRRFREILDSHDEVRAVAPRPLAVIMYDIDNFKQINEEMGHIHADGVLIRIGVELRKCFRDADTVARFGGDEMVVLAHVESSGDAVMMGQRSLEQVRSRIGVDLSAGVAVYPTTASSLDDAVRAADEALGRSKQAGKARVTLAPARVAAA